MSFQEHFSDLLRNKLTATESLAQPSSERPVRVFCEAESRFGLLPVQRRCITLSGVKPMGPVQYQFENFYLYGAVEPSTGDSFFLELPHLTTVNFQLFLKEFAQHYQDTLNIVVLDNGSCHKAKALIIPANVVCLFLPPYSPELNPIERLWQAMKAQLAWVLTAAIDELEHHVEAIIRHYSKAAIHSLTAYPYFVRAVHALGS
jgi:transposase